MGRFKLGKNENKVYNSVLLFKISFYYLIHLQTAITHSNRITLLFKSVTKPKFEKMKKIEMGFTQKARENAEK